MPILSMPNLAPRGKMKTYNILSLDGGGLRGLITTTLLERIEAAAPGFLANASLIVGTSTGGILALALAQGLAPYRIMRMYLDDGPQIFHRSLGRKIGSLLGLREAKYNNDGLKKALQEVFGDSKLKDLGKRVAVTAFKLDDQTTFPPTWRPKIFHNYPGEDSDGEERVVNVALRTASAPTFFPSSDGYVDGGTFAGNPSVVALAQALDPRSQLGKMRDLSCIRLLSVGTGENATYLPGGRLDWGVGQWAMPLVNILLDGVAGIADFQCRQILREKYFRLQVELPEDKKIPMDSVNDLSLMLGIGQQSPIRPAVQWLRDQGWT